MKIKWQSATTNWTIIQNQKQLNILVKQFNIMKNKRFVTSNVAFLGLTLFKIPPRSDVLSQGDVTCLIFLFFNQLICNYRVILEVGGMSFFSHKHLVVLFMETNISFMGLTLHHNSVEWCSITKWCYSSNFPILKQIDLSFQDYLRGWIYEAPPPKMFKKMK